MAYTSVSLWLYKESWIRFNYTRLEGIYTTYVALTTTFVVVSATIILETVS